MVSKHFQVLGGVMQKRAPPTTLFPEFTGETENAGPVRVEENREDLLASSLLVYNTQK
jgi:hypothetical protein